MIRIRQPRASSALLAALLATAAVAAGCAPAPTPYQAVQRDGAETSYGYTEQKLTDDRYRVTVTANEATSRATVEAYLLYRAAELARAEGDDAFRVVERNLHPSRRYITTYLTGYPFQPPQPYRVYEGRLGEIYGSPDGGTRRMTRYTASAEIQLLERLPAEADERVYEASRILSELGPVVRHPDRTP